MVFIKKVNNADAGDADHVGGNDWDTLDDYHADVDITGPALINTETRIRKDKLKIGDTSNDHFVTISNGEQAADRTLNIPVLAGTDTIATLAEAQTLTNKTISGASNTITNVGTSSISDDAITYAKIQNVSATDRLLGRDTAGAGDVEELTATGGIEFTGTGIQTSAFTGDVTKSAGGTATTIANDAVTNAKLNNMAANTIKGNNTSGAADPSDISVGTNTVLGRVAGDIVAAQVATGQIADDAVTYAKIQDVSASDRILGRDTAAAGVVEELTVSGGIEFTGSGGIQTSAFTGDVTKAAGGTATTIADDAVTYAKIQNVVNDDRFLGRISGANGVIEELTGTQATTLLDAFTDVLKGVAPASGGGTTNFLRADGTWAAPPGGGGGDSVTVNGVAVVDADLDDATPAAPAGGVNVKWQKDASSPANISAHLAAGDVSNTVLADMAANTIKGNATAGAADPSDISVGTNTVLGRKGGNIVAETIATDQIAADAVTYAKIQNVSNTDRLLGRDTAAAGDVEELTVGGGIEFTGSGGIQTSALTGDVTKTAGGTATTIANDAVTFAKMQNITDARLLGRNAGSDGDCQHITLGDGLEFSSQTLNFDSITRARYRVEWVDDCFGQTSSTASHILQGDSSGTGSAVTPADVAETGVWGVYDLETGTTNGSGYGALHTQGTSQAILIGQGVTTMEGRIKVPSSLSDGTTTYKILFGLLDDFTTATVNDGVYFEYIHSSSTFWRYCTSNDTVRSESNSASTVNASTWYRLKIVINADATSVEYFVNGSSVGTQTANIPTATDDGLNVVVAIVKTLSANERIMSVDYVAFQMDLTSAR